MSTRDLARLLRLLTLAPAASDAQRSQRDELTRILAAASRGARISRPQQAQLAKWLRSDAAMAALEALWAQDMEQVLSGQGAQLVQMARRALGGPLNEETVNRFLGQAASYLDRAGAEVLAGAVRPLIDATAEMAALRLVGRSRISFDVLQPGILEFTDEKAAELITQVTNTTKQWVREEMKAALEAGESTQAIARRIRQNRSFGRWRSELIARTETTRVSNGSRQRGIQGMVERRGGSATKTRVSAGDNRVRPEHRRINGETRPIDQPYSNGEMYPGEKAILCRCTEVYAFASNLNQEVA